MNEEDNEQRKRIGLWPVAGGVFLFLMIQYIFAVVRLSGTSNSMLNKFSKLAQDKYLDYLIAQNLYVGIGYLIVGFVFLLLLWPYVSVISSRLVRKTAMCGLLMGFLGSFLIHGFFVLRLVKTRPYFLEDAKFGSWYFQALALVPESAKPVVYFLFFTIVPLLVVGFGVIWYFRRLTIRWKAVSCLCLLLISGLVGFRMHISKGVRGDVVAGGEKQWNVIIIGSDSLRSDRLGCNGYRPRRNDGMAAAGVSPNIDRLAAKSFNFRNCHTPIASTMESGTSLMSAQYPHSHGLRHMYPSEKTVNQVRNSIRPIAELLRERGYDTAAIGDWCAGYYEIFPMGFEEISVSSFDNFKVYMSQAVVMSHFLIPLYFDNAVGYELFPQIGSFAQFVTPEVVTARVKDRMKQVSKSGEPFFWHVFYSCNHLPYRSPEPYRSMFSDPGYDGPNKNGVDFDIDAFIGGTDLEDKWNALPEKEVRQIRDLYDGCTRMFDDNVGSILNALEESGLSENTIVIVTADHGDNLYEEGVTLGHGLTFNGGLHANHIPLVFHVPGLESKVIEKQVNMIDVIPTLGDLLELEKPADWEGRSFAAWMNGKEQPKSRAFYGETGFPFIQFRVDGVERPELPPMDEMTEIDEAFNFQFVLKDEFEDPLIAAKQRCLATENWKMICTPAKDGRRHFGLFQRGTHASLEKDVSLDYPAVAEKMRKALERWMDEGVETPIEEMFPEGDE